MDSLPAGSTILARVSKLQRLSLHAAQDRHAAVLRTGAIALSSATRPVASMVGTASSRMISTGDAARDRASWLMAVAPRRRTAARRSRRSRPCRVRAPAEDRWSAQPPGRGRGAGRPRRLPGGPTPGRDPDPGHLRHAPHEQQRRQPDADRHGDHHVEHHGQAVADQQHQHVAARGRPAAMCAKCFTSDMFQATSNSSAARPPWAGIR